MEIFGTDGNDVLAGTPLGDVINGGEGNDIFSPEDVLAGTPGNDHLVGGTGDDTIDGGDGDDIIYDGGGNNTLRGGDGNDSITFANFSAGLVFDTTPTTNLIDAGSGDDYVDVTNGRLGTLAVNLGAGDDHLVIGGSLSATTISLGAGRDRVDFGGTIGNDLHLDALSFTITDFVAGAAGDILNLGDLVQVAFASSQTKPSFDSPFLGGFLTLVQDGADTILRIDFDGNGPGAGIDIVRLQNVIASQITAENLAGFAPDGGAPVPETYHGTEHADQIEASVVGGHYFGLGGDDQIIGNRSADILEGGAGNDYLAGSEGDDVMIGGDGDDVLDDSVSGNDRFDGGAGNDVISIVRHAYRGDATIDALTINGGEGDDSVTIDYIRDPYTAARSATFTADLGAGNDYMYIAHARTNGTLTLGGGRDRVELGDQFFDFGQGTTTITDFAVGPGGDVLDVSSALLTTSNYDPSKSPISTGYLRVVQQGADTLISVDYDGQGGSDALMTLFRLVNVDANSLTAENLNGYGRDGSIQNVTITGTASDDRLWGGVGTDHLAGGDGKDWINGGQGNDIVDGGAGDDTLEGGFGNDQLLGGDGNDLIQDSAAGSDTLRGGDGDDRIVVSHLFNDNVSAAVTIDAGAGDDDVTFSTVEPGSLTADLGAGDDHILLQTLPAGGTTLTLGSGSDVVTLDSSLASQARGPLTITDFQAGDGGDRLDWMQFARSILYNSDPAFNPFQAGEAHLVQSGSDVLLQIDTPATITLVRFANTTLSALTDYNFGVDIHAAPPSTADTLTGTAGNDVLHGTVGADIISGLAGDDQIFGDAGNDVLHGGDGKDTLYGGAGDDTLDGGTGRDTVDGGDGNDVITDLTGEDVITGGAGNDTISVKVDFDALNNGVGSLDAGDGDDLVTILNNGYTTYSASMGAGDDTVSITGLAEDVTLSLGAGRDTIRFDNYGPGNSSVLTITDFQAGAGGDRVDFLSMLNHMLTFLSGDIPAGANPFALGFATLEQVGNDVVLYFDLERVAGGLYRYPIARFIGTTVAQFTADNFAGADPATTGASAPHAIINNVTIAAGQVDAATNVYPHFTYIGSGSGNVQFVNHGVVTTTGTTSNDALGFLVNYGGSIVSAASLFDNAVDGVFRVVANGPASDGLIYGETYGFKAPGSYVRFTNEGLFEVTAAGGTATGVLTGYSTLGLANVNSGTIKVTSGYDAYGVQFAGFDGTFTNNGTINVHGDDYAIGIYSDQYNGDRILNNGTITVTTSPDSPYASIGILLFEGYPNVAYTHINTGTINADIAFAVISGSNNLHTADTLVNSGAINGTIILGDGNDVLHNTGSISGRTLLGTGNDLYDGRGGTHSGSIEGGDGADVLIGGNGGESLYGDEGADQISGGGGDDFVDGGQGGDALDGGAGFDILSYYESLGAITIDLSAGIVTAGGDTDYIRNFEEVVGSRGNDVVIGSVHADTLLGANGDDHLSGGVGDDILLGNAGNDVLSGGSGNDRFIFQAGDGHDEITDFAAGDSIEIYGATAAQSVTQVGADVLVTLSATDSILVRNTSVAAVNANYLHFITTPLDINLPAITDHPIHVVQNLSISAGVSYALGDVDPSSTLVSRATTAPSAIALEFVNPDNDVSLWNAGHVAFHTTTTGTITLGVAAGDGGTAYLGALVNHAGGEIDVTADHADAYGTFGIGSVYNDGTISVASLSGNATGIYDLDGLDGSAFVNTGHIDVTAATEAQGVAQAFTTSAGPTGYFNSGVITAHGGTASIGVAVHFSAHPAVTQPYFVNSGTITVADGTAAIDSVGLDVDINSSPSIWNSGTISGDIALHIGNSGSYNSAGLLAHIYNSGALNGLVNLDTYDDVLVNTGTITGAISLGGGDDVYDGRLGTLAGNVDGYDGNDIILAGIGNQHLFGGIGDDYLSGGAGADLLTGGAGRDTFRYETGGGADQITDFEGGGAHDYISIGGYSAYQSLAQSGQDVLVTFSATDTLLVHNATVAGVSAALSFGTASLAAYTIPAAPSAPPAPADPPAAVNNLTFLPIVGTEAGDTLTGDIGPDDLRGLGGDDILDGKTGADHLYGGLGSDTYHVDRPDDVVFENANEGTDTVISTAGYYLYANIENLTLAAGAGDIFGVGNELANILTGNEGSNLLIAGAGADVVHGGAGVDSLFGQDGNDQLFGDAGIDYLVGGTGDDMLDGGTNADALYGEDGNDVLWGGTDFQTDILVGGAGNDVLHGDSHLGDYDLMDGGSGDDIYYVDTPDDLTFEAANGGTDTVHADIVGAGYYLYANVENLILDGNTPYGVGNELDNHLTGNAIGNYLLGGAGNDVLNGKAGNDVLFGEAGADTFVFEHGTGGDVIGDFQAGTDKIDLSAMGFTSFGQVQAAMGQNGADSFINLGGGDLVVLNGVAMTSLHADDFILSTGGGSATVAAATVAALASASSAALGVEGFQVALDALAGPQAHEHAAPAHAWALDIANDNGALHLAFVEAQPPIDTSVAVA